MEPPSSYNYSQIEQLAADGRHYTQASGLDTYYAASAYPKYIYFYYYTRSLHS